jgi:hypothetical protein
MLGRNGLVGMAVMVIGLMFAQPGLAQQKKIEGWANVPGGTVWLEPGKQAYEHDTGLVRDLRTGQKFMPIRPHSVPSSTPMAPVLSPVYAPTTCPKCPLQPSVPVSPYSPPYVITPYLPMPVPPTYYGPYNAPPRYDLGPNNMYGRSVGGYGAKLGAPGAISNRWPAGKLPR